MTTSQQFDKAIALCKDIFLKKMKDYGSAWRVLRLSSITDQIFIKAQRIRSIEEKGKQKVEDGIKEEFIGIVNYAVIALTQLDLGDGGEINMSYDDGKKYFEKHVVQSKNLMENKNHDYDEAWRQMRISSITDLILMKLYRLKQIENNKGETLISEGRDANYYDIINYAVFALIRLDEKSI
jgi:hypothetical protein